jgi:hypothetical protein
LSGVAAIDSAGIRALVGGHTGVASAVLCTALVILAGGRTFPAADVENVCARDPIVFEPREISQCDDVTVMYFTWLDARTSLEDPSAQLMANGAAVKSVAWEHPKRERP